MLTTNIIKLLWGKPDAWAFWVFLWILRHPVFNSLTCDLRDTMPRQRSITLFAHMWLAGYHATPEVTHTLFPSHPFLPWMLRIWESVFYSQVFFTLDSLYLGKRRISLGISLRLHTWFDYHQKSYIRYVLFKPYGRSNLWRICSSRDLNSFHDKRSMLKVLFHIHLATELDDL